MTSQRQLIAASTSSFILVVLAALLLPACAGHGEPEIVQLRTRCEQYYGHPASGRTLDELNTMRMVAEGLVASGELNKNIIQIESLVEQEEGLRVGRCEAALLDGVSSLVFFEWGRSPESGHRTAHLRTIVVYCTLSNQLTYDGVIAVIAKELGDSR